MKKALLPFIGLILCLNIYGQECADVKFKIRGYFYAGSSVVDTVSPGGFYEASNTPKPIDQTIQRLSPTADFNIIAKVDSTASLSTKIRFFKVFIVNKTDSVVALPAQDSRIYLKRQVFYKGEWQDVEYLPSSWCGNSYHTVSIRPNEFWEFDAPCLSGKIEAKFRFELYVSKDVSLYSNEFLGSFNKRQLTKEQGHTPSGLMDSYNN